MKCPDPQLWERCGRKGFGPEVTVLGDRTKKWRVFLVLVLCGGVTRPLI
jgi:hypothetical protein